MQTTARALIVEDEVALRLIYEKLLQDMGFSVVYARDGEAALDVLKQLTPQLIFLDMLLPVVDGKTVLEYVRADTRFEQTRVVMTSSAQEFAQLSNSYPSTEFLLKPILPAQIKEIGERVLAQLQT